jgi:hypothetical protein
VIAVGDTTVVRRDHATFEAEAHLHRRLLQHIRNILAKVLKVERRQKAQTTLGET